MTTQPEVDTALDYIRSLLSTSTTAADQNAFIAALRRHVCARIASWDVRDPERGSAARAILWQPHNGGEGLDESIVGACNETVAEGKGTSELQSIAASLLPQPFTLWIDPGCVAVRTGAGPGSPSRTLFSTRTHKPAPSVDGSESLDVLYGQLSLGSPASATQPGLSLTGSSPSRAPARVIAARVGSKFSAPFQFPGNASRRSPPAFTPAVAAPTVSNRCPIGSNDSEMSCPSLSLTEDNDRDGRTSPPAARQQAPSPKLHTGSNNGSVPKSTLDQYPVPTGEAESPTTERPPAPGQTGKVSRLYDNGNVGVLGGGIKLGGGSKATPLRTRARAMSTKASATAQPNLRPSRSGAFQHSTAPVRTVPLPQVSTWAPGSYHAYHSVQQHAQIKPSQYNDQGMSIQPTSSYPVHTCGALTPVELHSPVSPFEVRQLLSADFSPIVSAASPESLNGHWPPTPRTRRSRARAASRSMNRQANALNTMLCNGLDPWETDMQLDVDVNHLDLPFEEDGANSDRSSFAETDSEGGSLRSFSSGSCGSSTHALWAAASKKAASAPWTHDAPAIGLNSFLGNSGWSAGSPHMPSSGASTPALWNDAPLLFATEQKQAMSTVIDAPFFRPYSLASPRAHAALPSQQRFANHEENTIGLQLGGMPTYRPFPPFAPGPHVNFA